MLTRAASRMRQGSRTLLVDGPGGLLALLAGADAACGDALDLLGATLSGLGVALGVSAALGGLGVTLGGRAALDGLRVTLDVRAAFDATAPFDALAPFLTLGALAVATGWLGFGGGRER